MRCYESNVWVENARVQKLENVGIWADSIPTWFGYIPKDPRQSNRTALLVHTTGRTNWVRERIPGVQPDSAWVWRWAGWRGTGRLNPSRETSFSGTHGDRGILIFLVQLTTSRIGNLTNLCWVEYYSWRTRVFYSSMYSTQHTHSLSTAFHTLLNILIAWVPLSILDSKYSKLEYRFPYSTRVWVRYRANTQRWVEYRAWLSILDSKYSKLEYNFPYSTQNTQSLSTTSHTRLNILIAWVQLSILYSSMSTVSGKYSTMSRVSSMTFHTRLKILKAWV